MDLTVYTQFYRCKTADRQREIDECLRRNLNHPAIRKLVLFKESDAPPLPQATVELEVVESDQRITYAEWLRWVQRQGSGIALLLNADIYLDEGLEHLAATFDTPEAFLALTRYNPGHAGFHLNDYPHWTQDVWGVRAEAELPESQLYASSFPLGFPGCDNRIAYGSGSVQLQASTACAYDKTRDRPYGGVNYVHLCLASEENAEPEFTQLKRLQERLSGALANQQSIELRVHHPLQENEDKASFILNKLHPSGSSWEPHHWTTGMNAENTNYSFGHIPTREIHEDMRCRHAPRSIISAAHATLNSIGITRRPNGPRSNKSIHMVKKAQLDSSLQYQNSAEGYP